MKIEKPPIEKIKERANELFKYLISKEVVTKKQICEDLFNWNWNTSNERRIREIISTLAQVKPIIATSDSKGYKLAKSKEDAEDILHQFAELSSRVVELQKRIVPILLFCERHGINTVNS